LTIGSLIGFVTLFGITTRNSIMMISHFEHLVTRRDVVEPGCRMRGRVRAVDAHLMTGTVTALGLLPLALARRGGPRDRRPHGNRGSLAD